MRRNLRLDQKISMYTTNGLFWWEIVSTFWQQISTFCAEKNRVNDISLFVKKDDKHCVCTIQVS